MAMLSQPETVQDILALSGKHEPRVLYLGTATYDDRSAQETQTRGFSDVGCAVTALEVAWASPSKEEMLDLVARADIVLVSGGNTLFALDRWVTLGLDNLLKDAAGRGVVMCGGSAGAIVWFDGGHSDSMDAKTFKNPPGPYLNPAAYDPTDPTAAAWANWAYIRTPGLQVVPGLFCPHYDATQVGRYLSTPSTTIIWRNLPACRTSTPPSPTGSPGPPPSPSCSGGTQVGEPTRFQYNFVVRFGGRKSE
jgi:dipeptidase E